MSQSELLARIVALEKQLIEKDELIKQKHDDYNRELTIYEKENQFLNAFIEELENPRKLVEKHNRLVDDIEILNSIIDVKDDEISQLKEYQMVLVEKNRELKRKRNDCECRGKKLKTLTLDDWIISCKKYFLTKWWLVLKVMYKKLFSQIFFFWIYF